MNAHAGPPPTIALIDPLWYGHHPMYFAQFTTSFLKAGARVIGLCPEPAEATADAITAAAFRGIPDAAERISMHHLPAGKRSWFGNRFEGDPWRTFQRWRRAANALDEAEALTRWHADLVYFPYLDSYLRFLPVAQVPATTFGRPWSGLYLRNHHHAEPPSPKRQLRFLAKGDALMRSDLCRGIGVLDERFNGSLEAYTGQPVVSYPDATNTEITPEPTALARTVLAEARGRKIIGLIGLEKRKGLLTLLKVAVEADRLKLPWFFVCGGVFGRHLFQPDEQAFIDGIVARVQSGGLDNLHFDPAAKRIGTDAEFNSLFSTFNIAWTAYEGFEGSSGALTKAAEFNIPSLATAGECIGARVERHRIGLAIPEGDPTKALEAIRRIFEAKDWDDRPLNPDYETYRSEHNLARLDTILAALVAGVIP
ncbi:glycosyl transferase [Luteolibacter sp. LG18]|nr:glycosyl transferase [Luteolibacter sp. LG18]